MLQFLLGFSVDRQAVLNMLGLLFVFLLLWSFLFILASVSTNAENRSPGDANACGGAGL